jgi:hypothetical protein
MAKMRNTEITSDKFNVVGICTSEKCVQKWTSSFIIINLMISPKGLKHYIFTSGTRIMSYSGFSLPSLTLSN